MTRVTRAGIGLTAIALMLGSQGMIGSEQRRARSLKASLSGFEEPPSVFSTGQGRLELKVNRDDQSIDYELTFEDLVGTVTQSHIHIAQRGVNGGIAIWLCGTATNPGPTGTPSCGGPNDGHVTGTIFPANVLGSVAPSVQFIPAGNLDDVLVALRAGYGYVNVHTNRNPGGEIRGQIRVDDRDHDRR